MQGGGSAGVVHVTDILKGWQGDGVKVAQRRNLSGATEGSGGPRRSGIFRSELGTDSSYSGGRGSNGGSGEVKCLFYFVFVFPIVGNVG